MPGEFSRQDQVPGEAGVLGHIGEQRNIAVRERRNRVLALEVRKTCNGIRPRLQAMPYPVPVFLFVCSETFDVELLQQFHIEGLTADEKEHWNRVWHRLKPWPDSVAGLAHLKRKYTIAPLSNGNVALLTDMAKHAGLPWDLILSAELARHYKPDREAYLTAVSLLELKPEEVMMCAAHSIDLMSARSFGLRTGFIPRPIEYGPTRKADDAEPGDFDVDRKRGVCGKR